MSSSSPDYKDFHSFERPHHYYGNLVWLRRDLLSEPNLDLEILPVTGILIVQNCPYRILACSKWTLFNEILASSSPIDIITLKFC